MKVLFLTLANIKNIESQGIYTDLLRKFRDEGNEVTIVCPIERKYNTGTSVLKKNGITILKVWTTNIQKTNIFEKGLTTLLVEYFFLIAIKKHINYNNYDLIIYTTPPITLTNLIIKLKKITGAKTYLLLKDIFPQNAVDLKLLKVNSFLYKYFRNKEKLLYKISDYIGCMSASNLSYILKENPNLGNDKVEINPNSIQVKEDSSQHFSKIELFLKYNIPLDKTIFLLGGNLGLPQGLDFLKKNIANCRSIKDAFFLIIGNGTEFNNFKEWIEFERLNTVKLIKELPQIEYEKITKCVDVGLIFLNPNFTIPNFPSRLLSYMQYKLPVICATDSVTDIGAIANDNGFGFSCLASDLNSFFNIVVRLQDKKLRLEMGDKAYNFLKKEYSVEVSYRKIVNKFTQTNNSTISL
jgi:glycosyltransferase involved in cell wall biosynthesis